MNSPREHDLLLKAVDPTSAELARELLQSNGIPSLLEGPDFDRAELGSAAHAVVRHPDLYVPNGARERARTVLVEAWGESKVLEHES